MSMRSGPSNIQFIGDFQDDVVDNSRREDDVAFVWICAVEDLPQLHPLSLRRDIGAMPLYPELKHPPEFIAYTRIAKIVWDIPQFHLRFSINSSQGLCPRREEPTRATTRAGGSSGPLGQ